MYPNAVFVETGASCCQTLANRGRKCAVRGGGFPRRPPFHTNGRRRVWLSAHLCLYTTNPPPIVSLLDGPARFEPLETEVRLMVALPFQYSPELGSSSPTSNSPTFSSSK